MTRTWGAVRPIVLSISLATLGLGGCGIAEKSDAPATVTETTVTKTAAPKKTTDEPAETATQTATSTTTVPAPTESPTTTTAAPTSAGADATDGFPTSQEAYADAAVRAWGSGDTHTLSEYATQNAMNGMEAWAHGKDWSRVQTRGNVVTYRKGQTSLMLDLTVDPAALQAGNGGAITAAELVSVD